MKYIKKDKAAKVHMCHCGEVAVRKSPGAIWSCQRCIDMDQFVASLHERAARKTEEVEVTQ